jgi:hypothetical protein
MTSEEIEIVSATAAKAAVHETMRLLGIDANDPFEMQRDFAHLRSWRKSVESVQRRVLLTSVGILTTGIVAAIWMVLKPHS